MKARIIVTLKSGVLDPQGQAIAKALSALGFDGVSSVRQGRYFELELDGLDEAQAEEHVAQMCDRLLANTVIENYRVDILD
jgi:phosphoribosylformylglycinamidine synthase PurS subunit